MQEGNLCVICGDDISSRRKYCTKCAKVGYRQKIKEWHKKHPNHYYLTSANMKDLEKKEEA